MAGAGALWSMRLGEGLHSALPLVVENSGKIIWIFFLVLLHRYIDGSKRILARKNLADLSKHKVEKRIRSM